MRCVPVILSAAAATALAGPPAQVRFATFNTSLFRTTETGLFTDLSNPATVQVKRVAEIIQRTAPDVLLVNEFDWSAAGHPVVQLFHDNFLAVSQNGQTPLNYPYRYTAKPNTGFSPLDLNEDGVISVLDAGGVLVDFDNNGSSITTQGTAGYENDCFGFGIFRGQYGMTVYSRYPIRTAAVRTFRRFLWKDMPGALLPDQSATPAVPQDWYSTAELGVFRLSSKSHWDLPIDLGGGITAHFLCAHPTPPIAATANRNALRNHDEIRFWADYIDPARSAYQRDDAGVSGGLPRGARFVIAGDYNADPVDGDSHAGAARQFTTHPLIDNSVVPSAAAFGNSSTDTANFRGGLRVDYVLPSVAGFSIAGSGVFWPPSGHALASLASNASDHRLVWMDLRPEPEIAEAVRDLRVLHEPGQVRFTFLTVPGYTYSVQETEDLSTGPWPPVIGSPVQVAEDFSAMAKMPVSAPGRRFFRIAAAFAP
jgi:Endonuclease/Exonuclease/phosphatase family